MLWMLLSGQQTDFVLVICRQRWCRRRCLVVLPWVLFQMDQYFPWEFTVPATNSVCSAQWRQFSSSALASSVISPFN